MEIESISKYLYPNQININELIQDIIGQINDEEIARIFPIEDSAYSTLDLESAEEQVYDYYTYTDENGEEVDLTKDMSEEVAFGDVLDRRLNDSKDLNPVNFLETAPADMPLINPLEFLHTTEEAKARAKAIIESPPFDEHQFNSIVTSKIIQYYSYYPPVEQLRAVPDSTQFDPFAIDVAGAPSFDPTPANDSIFTTGADFDPFASTQYNIDPYDMDFNKPSDRDLLFSVDVFSSGSAFSQAESASDSYGDESNELN